MYIRASTTYLFPFQGTEFLKKKSFHVHRTRWIPDTWQNQEYSITNRNMRVIILGAGFQFKKPTYAKPGKFTTPV